MKLKDTIKGVLLGGLEGGGALSMRSVQALEEHSVRYRGLTLTVLGFQVLLTCVAVVVVFRATDGQSVAAAAGATGLFGTAGSAAMWKFVREWNDASILQILLADADEATIRQLLERYMRNR